MSSKSHLKLRHIVDHVFDIWDNALGRWSYFRSLGQHSELAMALTPSYAAHVHNALQDALLIDSLRELGAVILDRDERSASLQQAMRLIKSKEVLDAIRKEYEVVPPVRHMNEDLPPALLAEIDAQIHQDGLERNRREFEELYAKVMKIDVDLLEAPITSKIREARNTSVAHYDVRKAGPDWKTLTVGDAGLTFGDMDAYFENCTEAVKVITLFVHRRSMDFAASHEIFKKRVNEYIDAMIRGRGAQKAEIEERRMQVDNDKSQ
jgi:hypothetical protein